MDKGRGCQKIQKFSRRYKWMAPLIKKPIKCSHTSCSRCFRHYTILSEINVQIWILLPLFRRRCLINLPHIYFGWQGIMYVYLELKANCSQLGLLLLREGKLIGLIAEALKATGMIIGKPIKCSLTHLMFQV